MGVTYIKLDAVVWEAVRSRVLLITQAEQELARHRLLLETLVQQATGVDVTSGNWNLDVDHGILEGAAEDVVVEVPTDDLTPRRKSRQKSQADTAS